MKCIFRWNEEINSWRCVVLKEMKIKQIECLFSIFKKKEVLGAKAGPYVLEERR
jgi:hypothetical protein